MAVVVVVGVAVVGVVVVMVVVVMVVVTFVWWGVSCSHFLSISPLPSPGEHTFTGQPHSPRTLAQGRIVSEWVSEWVSERDTATQPRSHGAP